MKILHVISSLGTGGAEKLILDTIPEYNKRGIITDVLLLWDNNHLFTQKLQKENCCKVFILNKGRNYKKVYSIVNILKIRRIMKNYDIIHSHLSQPQYFVAVANYGLNKYLVFTEHNTTNRRMANSAFKLLEKWCYNRYHSVIAISDEIKVILNNYLRISDKITVINNGVNIDKFINAVGFPKSEISSNIKKEDRLIIQVSAFRPQKDQDALIQALKYLPSHYKVLLVGDGERRKELEELVKQEKLIERVVFLGQRMDVPTLLKSSDYVVLSSKYEGLSLSSVEGMASGKPFIASDVPGLTEIVRGAGYLFQLGDSKQLVEIILNLDRHIENYQQISNLCQQRAKQFDIKNMINNHIKLYQKLYNEKD